MDRINNLIIRLGIDLVTFKKNYKLENIVDPLQTIIKLAIISECPTHSKLSIKKNMVVIQMPNYYQGLKRWLNDDNYQDLFYIFNSCKYFSHFYKKQLESIHIHTNNKSNNLYLLLKQMSLKGIDKLIETYSSKNDNRIIELLKIYKFIIKNEHLNIKENEIKISKLNTIYNDTSEFKYQNHIFQNINTLYTEDDFYILYFLLKKMLNLKQILII